MVNMATPVDPSEHGNTGEHPADAGQGGASPSGVPLAGPAEAFPVVAAKETTEIDGEAGPHGTEAVGERQGPRDSASGGVRTASAPPEPEGERVAVAAVEGEMGTADHVAGAVADCDTVDQDVSPGAADIDEGFQVQFAFRPDGPPPGLKRQMGDRATSPPPQGAKRFRGYANEVVFNQTVPTHMRDGVKRLNKELIEFVNDPPGNVTAGPTGDNLYEWAGLIRGPKATPYEGGTWMLNIKVPDNYPYEPPQVDFKNKIYHCNVDEAGNVCLNILKKDWNAALSIRTVLLSISALLACPNPDDPLREDVAQLFLMDRAEHDRIAKRVTLDRATCIPDVAISPAKNDTDGTPASSPPVTASGEAGLDDGDRDTRGAEIEAEEEDRFKEAIAAARRIASAEHLERQGGKTTLEVALEARRKRK